MQNPFSYLITGHRHDIMNVRADAGPRTGSICHGQMIEKQDTELSECLRSVKWENILEQTVFEEKQI